MERNKLSIIIVNYNTSGLLYDCLESIADNLTVDYEVIVFDNASSDDSVSRCIKFRTDSRFIFICSDSNLGFAKANNAASNVATGDFFHFLNPDTRVSASINDDYLEVFENPDHVYVNPLRNRDGTLENRPMPIPLLKDLFYWYLCRRKSRIWYKGASVIIPKTLFYQIGRWCEEYFMYSEDLELFYSIWKKGIQVVPLSSEIYHYGGASSSSRWSSLERETAVQRSARLFYRRNFSILQYHLVKLYFVFHYLFKNPRRIPDDIRAWIRSKS